MRFGIWLTGLVGRREIMEVAVAVERLGYAGVVLPDGDEPGAGLIDAAAVASVTDRLELLVAAHAEGHPLELAEDVAVCDQIAGGRVSLFVRGGDAQALRETTEILELTLTGSSIEHHGERYRIPAMHPSNEWARADALTVTPPPSRLIFPVGLTGGQDEADLARATKRPFLAGPGWTYEDLAEIGFDRVALSATPPEPTLEAAKDWSDRCCRLFVVPWGEGADAGTAVKAAAAFRRSVAARMAAHATPEEIFE